MVFFIDSTCSAATCRMRTEDHDSCPKSVFSLNGRQQSVVFVKFRKGNTVFRQTHLKGRVSARNSYLRTMSFFKIIQRQRQVNGA
jgi:hypothetical protein